MPKKSLLHPKRNAVDQELIHCLFKAVAHLIELASAQDDLIKTLTGEKTSNRSKAIAQILQLTEKTNGKRPAR